MIKINYLMYFWWFGVDARKHWLRKASINLLCYHETYVFKKPWRVILYTLYVMNWCLHMRRTGQTSLKIRPDETSVSLLHAELLNVRRIEPAFYPFIPNVFNYKTLLSANYVRMFGVWDRRTLKGSSFFQRGPFVYRHSIRLITFYPWAITKRMILLRLLPFYSTQRVQYAKKIKWDLLPEVNSGTSFRAVVYASNKIDL